MSARPRTGQEGFAMIAAMGVLLVLLLLTAVALAGATSNTDTQRRAIRSAQALEAAESAANQGWEQVGLARIDSFAVTSPCLQVSASSVAKVAYALLDVNNVHWCPAQTVTVPGASAASYQVSELTLDSALNVKVRYMLGQATAGGVTRRVLLKLGSNTTSGTVSLFGVYAVQSKSSVTLTNGQYIQGGGLRSDGSITLNTTSPPTSGNCHVTSGSGYVTPGAHQTVSVQNGATACGNDTTPAATPLTFTSISLPVLNDDATGISICPSNSCNALDPNNVSWNLVTKSLSTNNQGNVKLTGNTYVFCSLSMMNGTIHVAPTNGQPVSIYLGGCASGTPSFSIQNQSKLLNETGLGAKGLQIYMVGAGTMDFNNASATTTAVYAPTGSVSVRNDRTEIDGGVVANVVSFDGGQPRVVYDSSVKQVGTSGGAGSTSYPRANYAQCTAATTASNNPLGGC